MKASAVVGPLASGFAVGAVLGWGAFQVLVGRLIVRSTGRLERSSA